MSIPNDIYIKAKYINDHMIVDIYRRPNDDIRSSSDTELKDMITDKINAMLPGQRIKLYLKIRIDTEWEILLAPLIFRKKFI